LPRLDYEDIPVLFQGPEEAEKVDRFFVVERRSEPMPGEDCTSIGLTPGIEGFKVWKRGDYGCGLRSSLDRWVHTTISIVVISIAYFVFLEKGK
jgi:hypothetical protein